jgi:acyl-CoA synthetase (NDP forming)
MSSIQEANSERHYILLVIAIVIGLVGVYLRFADFRHASAVANVILAVGTGVALKAVFSIIK